MGFKENLRHYREKAGYKQAKEFAEKLGIPYSTYAGYEIKDREPKYELLCKIADLLDVSLDELLGRNDKYIKNDIIPKNDDDKLKIVLDDLLSPIKQETDMSIKVKSIDKEHVHFIFTISCCDIPISIEKKSIIDNINFIGEITNTTKRKIFQKRINDNIVEAIKNILIGTPVNRFSMMFFYLQSVLSSTTFIQDYEDNKELFPKIKMLIHKPEINKDNK